jgi:hypothetical protein
LAGATWQAILPRQTVIEKFDREPPALKNLTVALFPSGILSGIFAVKVTLLALSALSHSGAARRPHFISNRRFPERLGPAARLFGNAEVR